MSTTTALNYTSAKTFDLVQVSPRLAQEYLSKNTDNYRNLRPGKVNAYARDMAGDRWSFTGAPIVFDWNGVLRDGQHRLEAVVQSGVTIQFLVITGVDPEVQDVMDTNLARTAGDALGHHGYKNTNQLAATLNVLYCYESGLYKHAMSTPDSKVKLTNAEIVEAAGERPEMVEAAQFAVGMRHVLSMPTGALALAWRIFHDIDTDAASDFFARIENLQTRGKGDPIHTMIRRVSEYRERRESMRASTALFFLFRTWNAYRKGEVLQKLQVGSAEHGWVKIPEPR
jgi:hypothetical protein